MDDFLTASYTPKELQTINNCQMYLQVTTLAEITNHTGTHLLPNTMYHNNQIPSLTTITISNYQWPIQPSPAKAAWKLWTKVLQQQYTIPGLPTMLTAPLRPWLPHALHV